MPTSPRPRHTAVEARRGRARGGRGRLIPTVKLRGDHPRRSSSAAVRTACSSQESPRGPRRAWRIGRRPFRVARLRDAEPFASWPCRRPVAGIAGPPPRATRAALRRAHRARALRPTLVTRRVAAHRRGDHVLAKASRGRSSSASGRGFWRPTTPGTFFEIASARTATAWPSPEATWAIGAARPRQLKKVPRRASRAPLSRGCPRRVVAPGTRA